MNELTLFEKYDMNALRELEETKKDYDGFVYVLESDDAVKIGCTHKLVKRMSSLSSMLKNYAGMNVRRIAVTKPHINYRENEKKMHKLFSEYRKGGELFAIDFSTAVNGLSILYLETSEELRRSKSEKAASFLNGMKRFVLSGMPKQTEKCIPTHNTFAYNASMHEVEAYDAAALLLRIMLGEFVLSDEQRDDLLDLSNEIVKYKKCEFKITMHFDCTEIDDNSDLIEELDREETHYES